MGDGKTAMGLYKKVLAIDPSNVAAKDEIAMVMKDTMSPSEYIAYLSQNGSSDELYDYAYKLHKENKIDEAISAYKSSISKNSSKVDAYVNLAICYASKDDYNNAVSILNTAKEDVYKRQPSAASVSSPALLSVLLEMNCFTPPPSQKHSIVPCRPITSIGFFNLFCPSIGTPKAPIKPIITSVMRISDNVNPPARRLLK